MHPGRILFGLDRPPRGIAWDHERVPGVTPAAAPLRLNSHPVPAAFLPAGIARQHRRQAMQEWLEMACGDYAVVRRRFVAAYLAFVDAELQRCRADLEARLFGGLFAVEDWTWSALRPLPRAWINGPAGPVGADFMFWDGAALTAIQFDDTTDSALRQAGAVVLPVSPAMLDDDALFAHALPNSFRRPWNSERLPSSPFRRPIPPLC